MAVWYEVEKSEAGINDFLDCNWGFHDFRPELVSYVPGKDMVEIFLKYDTMREGVRLRFAWIHDMHINTQRDYDAEWIYDSTLIRLENNAFIWLDEEGDKNDIDDLKKIATWVEAERIFWAVTDGEGNPIEMPLDRIDQVWRDCLKNTITKKQFKLKEFDGNWDAILQPYYNR